MIIYLFIFAFRHSIFYRSINGTKMAHHRLLQDPSLLAKSEAGERDWKRYHRFTLSPMHLAQCQLQSNYVTVMHRNILNCDTWCVWCGSCWSPNLISRIRAWHCIEDVSVIALTIFLVFCMPCDKLIWASKLMCHLCTTDRKNVKTWMLPEISLLHNQKSVHQRTK